MGAIKYNKELVSKILNCNCPKEVARLAKKENLSYVYALRLRVENGKRFNLPKNTEIKSELDVILELFREDKTTKEIAHIYNVKPQVITNLVKRAGYSRVALKNEGRLRTAKQISKLYNEGHTLKEIEETLGLDRGKVRYFVEHLCKKFNVKLKRKFDKWSEEEELLVLKSLGIYDYKKIATLVGRSHSSVDHFCYRKNLSKMTKFPMHLIPLKILRPMVKKLKGGVLRFDDIIVVSTKIAKCSLRISYIKLVEMLDKKILELDFENEKIIRSMANISKKIFKSNLNIEKFIAETSNQVRIDHKEKLKQYLEMLKEGHPSAKVSREIYGTNHHGDSIKSQLFRYPK
ncbi:MAG: hypothetical protein GY909_15640 [Oligoflexia bacterium]|nr:hypothetical protein [Oligoflexia bacterium]